MQNKKTAKPKPRRVKTKQGDGPARDSQQLPHDSLLTDIQQANLHDSPTEGSEIDKSEALSSQWSVADAKNQLSEVIRRAHDEIQFIYRRGELSAVVLSPDEFKELDTLKKVNNKETIGSAFEAIREAAQESGYVIPIAKRTNRRVDWDISDASL